MQEVAEQAKDAWRDFARASPCLVRRHLVIWICLGSIPKLKVPRAPEQEEQEGERFAESRQTQSLLGPGEVLQSVREALREPQLYTRGDKSAQRVVFVRATVPSRSSGS